MQWRQWLIAEYLSKRNFVEHVHIIKNKVLSDHGPFSSPPMLKGASLGSKEHKENMEHMAKEVVTTLVLEYSTKNASSALEGLVAKKTLFSMMKKSLKRLCYYLMLERRKTVPHTNETQTRSCRTLKIRGLSEKISKALMERTIAHYTQRRLPAWISTVQQYFVRLKERAKE